MTNYYQLLCSSSEDGGGYADFGRKHSLVFLPEEGLVEDWVPEDLVLQKGELSDFLLTVFMGGRGCSVRLKTLLDEMASAKDQLQWLPFSVTTRNKADRLSYHLLHFPSPLDVLHKKFSHFDQNGIVIKPVISTKLAKGHHVFSFLGDEGNSLYVSEQVKQAIENQRLTGIIIAPALTS